MKDNVNDEDVQAKAILEFNEYIMLLDKFNISYETISQINQNAPDSIFLNNWFSTHKNENIPEGLLIIYPIKALNRRIEKCPEIIDKLKESYKYFVDLSYLEKENEFIESTGSLVFDHNNRKIFCCYSERATVKAVNVFMGTINKYTKNPYELISFKASDKNGKSIYHTNCIMAILEHHTIICLSVIKDETEKSRVKSSLQENRKIIEITEKQIESYCGNVINVKDKDGKTVLLMSQSAQNGFTNKQLQTLKKSYKVISVNINTIETVGGGSARCMVSELY
jgi:hypothetical protein